MIEVFLGNRSLSEKEKKQLVRLNDLWFNSIYSDMDFNSTVKNIIKSIDGVDYLGEYRIQAKFTKYAIGVKELSTGCKTVLNILACPDNIFDISECGENALEEVFKLDRGKVYIENFVDIAGMKGNIILHYNGKVRSSNLEELWELIYGLVTGV